MRFRCRWQSDTLNAELDKEPTTLHLSVVLKFFRTKNFNRLGLPAGEGTVGEDRALCNVMKGRVTRAV